MATKSNFDFMAMDAEITKAFADFPGDPNMNDSYASLAFKVGQYRGRVEALKDFFNQLKMDTTEFPE